jgi:hypothetical protein
MATRSVKSIAADCLGKRGALSIRRDLLCVFADDNPGARSLKARLEQLETKPFVRVAVVTIDGAMRRLQRDLDTANSIYDSECDAWVYCAGAVTVNRPDLLVLAQDDCLLEGHEVSDEEDALFDLGRDLGAEIVGYYISADTGGFRGCAAHPPGRRGFWVGDTATQWTWTHELTHVVGGNRHVSNTDNLMFRNTGMLTGTPPDLTGDQCERVRDDRSVERC